MNIQNNPQARRDPARDPALEPVRDAAEEGVPPPPAYESLRAPSFAPRRRHWPGVLAALVIGGTVAALLVSGHYEKATLGERIDHTLGSAGGAVQRGVDAVRDGASQHTERLAEAVGDASITAGVKTALAADPVLSALKIDVSTHDGVVSLQGPAPDEKARERASALAAAPDGVVRVDNRLVVATADAHAAR